MQTHQHGSMWGYWAGLSVGFFGTLTAVIYVQGCAGTLMGAAALVVLFLAVSVMSESVLICVGPKRWRARIRRAQWPQAFLLAVGLLVGAAPAMTALLLLRSNKPLQWFFWIYVAAFVVLFFGLPVLSWGALYLLSRRRPPADDGQDVIELDLP